MSNVSVTIVSGQTATVGVATSPASYTIGIPVSPAEYSISVSSGIQGPTPNTAGRTVAYPDGTSITVNTFTTDIATHINTQPAGTLTINAPGATATTPYDGQKLVYRIKSDNIQTFSWNPIFDGSTEIDLPAGTSGGGLFDYIGFMYNATASKWQLLAKVFGV